MNAIPTLSMLYGRLLRVPGYEEDMKNGHLALDQARKNPAKVGIFGKPRRFEGGC
jgi:hypothetical protein